MRDQEPEHPADRQRRLTTREAAELLGVKPETVYAYVSRGQLASRRTPGSRGSTFDADEVRALARRNRRDGGTAPAAGQELTVRTRLTLIESDRYYYRGVDAVELAARHTYEEVAEWLWTGQLRPDAAFPAPESAVAVARRAVDALPEHAGPADRLRVAAIAAAVTDPLRFDLTEDAVLGTARSLIPTLVAALPPVLRDGDVRDPIARRLWTRLSGQDADEPSLRALDTALCLLVDHDLAASTLAVRVAASARAHAYAAVSAGLGVIEGPLHGAAGGLAHRMLLEVLDPGQRGAGRRGGVAGRPAHPRARPPALPGRGPTRACPVRAPGGHPAGGTRTRGGPGRPGHRRPPHPAARQRRPGARRAHRVLRHGPHRGRDDLRGGPHGRLDRARAGGVRGAPAADAAEWAVLGLEAAAAPAGVVLRRGWKSSRAKSG
ncbi:hypothetical protein STENM36S_06229 [Streptomyces tendae]